MLGPDRTLGVEDAARACSVSDETIRRRLRAGRLPGARRDGGAVGAWRIPLADLIADGLTPVLPSATTGLVPEELAELRAALAEARALAAERDLRIGQLLSQLADLRTIVGLLRGES